jgi:hypothetical protein
VSYNNVIEGNTILAPNFGWDNLASQGVYIAASRTIIRGNVVRDSQGFGIDLEAFLVNAADAGSAATDDNRVYNNTAYDNGKLSSGTQLNEDGSGGLSLWRYEGPTSILRNHFKNNIAMLNNMGATNVQIVIVDWYSTGILSTQRFVNNIVRGTTTGQQVVYIDETGETITLAQAQSGHATQFTGNIESDPLFVNAASDDYHLQSGSPALNAGANLTTASGSATNSTSLTVADSYYFSAGITGITVGDEIRIGSASPVLVTAINYSTHVLTLAQARTWTSGASVNLERYIGPTAPNIGALGTA